MAYTVSARRSSSPIQTQRSSSPIQSHRAPVYTFAQPTTQPTALPFTNANPYAMGFPTQTAATYTSPQPAVTYTSPQPAAVTYTSSQPAATYASQPMPVSTQAIQGLQSAGYYMGQTATNFVSSSPVANSQTFVSSSVGLPSAPITYTSPGVPGFAASLSAPVFTSMNQGTAMEFMQYPSTGTRAVDFAPQATMQCEVRPLSEDRIRRAPAVYKGGSLAAPAGEPVFIEREVLVVQEPAIVEFVGPSGQFVQETIVVQESVGMVQETIIVQEPAAFVQETIIVQDPGAFVQDTIVVAEPAEFVQEAIIVQEPAVEPVPFQDEAPLPLPALEDPELMQALDETIGQGVRVCILGGKKFNDEATKTLVKALAAAFSYLANHVVILTGGMSGVQETFAKGCAEGPPVVNLLPQGEASNFGVGVDFAAFVNLDERILVFGEVGQIYIAVEGGPGVAKEARAAFGRDAIVIPLISTGGASGGMFDFPAKALEQPNFATKEQWDLLSVKGMPEETATAIVDMIVQLIQPAEENVEQPQEYDEQPQEEYINES